MARRPRFIAPSGLMQLSIFLFSMLGIARAVRIFLHHQALQIDTLALIMPTAATGRPTAATGRPAWEVLW